MTFLVCLSGIGCFHPTVTDGGFLCNTEVGPAKACPDGFSCEWASLTCKRAPNDAGAQSDARGDATDGPDNQPDADAGTPCFDARPGCDPSDAGVCDPFCQTGCGCHEKCTVTAAGSPVCASAGPGGIAPLGPCDVTNDTCGPGLVCLNDNCLGRCYGFCRTDADCPGSSCSRAVPGGQKVCDVAFVDACVPAAIPAGTSNGCPFSSQGCYLSLTHPSHTICDCPGGATGNMQCGDSSSCLPGLACVDPNGMGMFRCLQVCRIANNGQECPGGLSGSCNPYSGRTSTMMNATFGYCF